MNILLGKWVLMADLLALSVGLVFGLIAGVVECWQMLKRPGGEASLCKLEGESRPDTPTGEDS